MKKNIKFEKAERETLIRFNDADMEEGYFSFTTNKPQHWRALQKRVGKNIIEVKENKIDGRPSSWDVKVPSRYYSKCNFGIKKSSADQQNKSGDQE